MNVLVLGRQISMPRRDAEPAREHRFARILARNHHLTLAFVTDEADPVGAVGALRSEFDDIEFAVVPRGWKSLSSALQLLAGGSCTTSYYHSEALSTRLADRMRATPYDLIYVASSGMIRYALELDAGVPLVMDFGDMDSEWWLRQAAARALPAARFCRTEGLRLRLAEAAAARRASACVVASPHAARLLASFAPWAPTTVIPNGVDADRLPTDRPFSPAPTVLWASPVDGDAALEACAAILPAIRARVPHASFLVAGSGASPSRRRLAAIAGVTLTASRGDLRRLLHRATLALAPLDAAGRPGTVLEAMAAGIPVVTTPDNCRDLGAVPGRDAHAAEDVAATVDRAVELLDSEPARAALGARGAAFVRAQFSWESVGARLSRMLAATGRVGRPAALVPVADARLA